MVGFEHLFHIHRPCGALVVGRNGMELLQGGLDFVFDLCGGGFGLGGCHDHVDSLAEVVGLLESGDGQHDQFVGGTADVNIHFGLAAHTDNAKLYVAYAEHAPRDIATFGEEFAVDAVADDADFAVLANVDVVDVAPVEDGDEHHFREVRIHADLLVGAFAVAIADVVVPQPAKAEWRDDVGIRGFAAEDGEVAIDNVPLTAFLQTFVGQARGGSADEGGVGGETRDVRPDGGLERVAH